MGFNIENGATATVVFIQGLISFFSPCILPLVPVYFGYLSGGARKLNQGGEEEFSRLRAMRNTFFFVLGISGAFFLLGFGFTALGKFFSNHQREFAYVSGAIMIIFGILQLGVFGKKTMMSGEKRLPFNINKWSMGPIPAFLLGFTFSFAWTPCVGPVLASVLLLAGNQGSATKAVFLIALYTLGFVIPFLLLSVFTATIMNLFKKHKNVVKYTVKVGGVLLIIMGLLTVFGGLNKLSGYLGGIGTTQTQSQEDSSSEKSTEEASKSSETEAAEERELSNAIEIELKDQYGNVHKLSDYKGKTVFINFWATWCGPCRAEIPEIQKLYEDNGSNKNDVIILGITAPNMGQEGDVDHIKSFLKEHALTFPVLMDESGSTFSMYGIQAFPTTFMVNKDGKIYGYLRGQMDRETMDSIIKQTIEGSK